MVEAMPGKDRDDESGRYVDTYPADRFLDALSDLGGDGSTLEVAEAVGCHRDTARRKLSDLADAGRVTRRDVGDAALWVLVEAE